LSQNKEPLHFSHIEAEQNLGFAGGFNQLFDTALQASCADYFLVLNNDTEATHGFIENLIDRAEPDKIVSPMILWHKDKTTVIQCAGDFDRDMIKMDNFFAGQTKDQVPQHPIKIEQSDGCCFLIHRKWLEKGYRFNKDLFIYFEDVDFFLNLQKEGVYFEYVPSSVLYHKEYGASGGRETASAFRNYYFYRNRMFICKRLHKGLRRWRVYYRLCRLALAKYRTEQKASPKAAQAILLGLKDYFMGRMGKRFVP
jgi:GT2 family glycosyltransferase